MEYKVKKNEEGVFQFLSIDNNRIVFNMTFENAQDTIVECNTTITAMENYLETMNYMVDNNMSEYDPYVHGVWHDTGSTIKVLLTHEQNTSLVKNHPELLTYVLNPDNNVAYYIEEKYVYIYVNYFEEGHRGILEGAGALIFDNNEEVIVE